MAYLSLPADRLTRTETIVAPFRAFYDLLVSDRDRASVDDLVLRARLIGTGESRATFTYAPDGWRCAGQFSLATPFDLFSQPSARGYSRFEVSATTRSIPKGLDLLQYGIAIHGLSHRSPKDPADPGETQPPAAREEPFILLTGLPLGMDLGELLRGSGPTEIIMMARPVEGDVIVGPRELLPDGVIFSLERRYGALDPLPFQGGW